MHLIQLLLPVRDNKGNPFPSRYYIQIQQNLTKEFGGLTAFTRAPAEGLWKNNENTVAKDDIVIFEVMCKKFNESWWREYKKSLEKTFAQNEIIIRAQVIKLI
jgi:hypothetical protein